MGIYYHPPPPPTANSGGTPPEPHVPIGTQGSAPPRYSSVLMIAAVLASWPADLEPRLQRPNDQQQKIAPLTLTYGSQPTPQSPLSTGKLGQIAVTWAQAWDSQRAPESLAWDTPISPYLARTPPSALIWTAWEQPPVSPPRPVAIAPLTLPTGDGPPRPVRPSLLTRIVGAWEQSWSAQPTPQTAAWNIPVVVSGVPYTAPPSRMWQAWQAEAAVVPRPVAIAPLTLVYGNAPPVQGPISRANRLAIAAWPADGEPRLTPPNTERVKSAPLALVYGQAPPVRGGLSPQQIVVASWVPEPWPGLTAALHVTTGAAVAPVVAVSGEHLYMVPSHLRGFSVPGHDRLFTTTTHGRTHSVPSHDRLFSPPNRKRNV